MTVTTNYLVTGNGITGSTANAVASLVLADGKTPKLLLLGDSLNARGGDAFTALGGWVKTVTAIVCNPDGTATLTFSAAHNVPVGNQVRFTADATIDAVLRNRWFDFASVTSTTGTISVPADAVDREYLLSAIPSVVSFSGSSQSLQIDAIMGASGSWTQTLFELGQPFESVTNLCVPGARTGTARAYDTLALARTISFADFTHVGITVGLNDFANGVVPAESWANIQAITRLAVEAGCIVVVDDVYPQGSMDATKRAWLEYVNPRIHAMAAASQRIIAAPIYDIIIDPATDAANSVDLSDGTHQNATGAVKIGAARAKALAPFIKSVNRPTFAGGTTNYLPNGKMVGTGGTVSSGTGAAADSWTVVTTDSNIVCVCRKQKGRATVWRPATAYALGDVVIPAYSTGLYYVCTTAGTSGASAPTWGVVPWVTNTDGASNIWTAVPIVENLSSGDWQYLQGAVAGTAGSQERINFRQTLTLATVGLAAGDWIRMRMRVKVMDSQWRNHMLSIRTGSTIDSLNAWAADNAKNSSVATASMPFSNQDGVMMTPWWKIPAGQTSLICGIEGGANMTNSVIRMLVTDAAIEKRA